MKVKGWRLGVDVVRRCGFPMSDLGPTPKTTHCYGDIGLAGICQDLGLKASLHYRSRDRPNTNPNNGMVWIVFY